MSKKRATGKHRTAVIKTTVAVSVDASFAEVVSLIQQAQQRAYQAVNSGLIDLYWRVGAYISRKLQSAEWGDGVVAELAHYIQHHHPNIRGFTRASLFRMRQFYETYRGDRKVASLLRQLPWTHHLMILGRSRLPDERACYMRMAIREHWRSRELDRQIKASQTGMSSRVGEPSSSQFVTLSLHGGRRRLPYAFSLVTCMPANPY